MVRWIPLYKQLRLFSPQGDVQLDTAFLENIASKMSSMEIYRAALVAKQDWSNMVSEIPQVESLDERIKQLSIEQRRDWILGWISTSTDHGDLHDVIDTLRCILYQKCSIEADHLFSYQCVFLDNSDLVVLANIVIGQDEIAYLDNDVFYAIESDACINRTQVVSWINVAFRERSLDKKIEILADQQWLPLMD